MSSNYILILYLIFMSSHRCVGEYAEVGQFPWMVALLDLNMNYVCPGTLITDLHVISLADCFHTRATLMAFAGDISYMRANSNTKQLRSLIKVSIHPYYEKKKDPNYDVAIAMMSKEFTMSSYIQPIKFCVVPPEIGEDCYNMGWELKKKYVYSMDEDLNSTVETNMTTVKYSSDLPERESLPSHMLQHQRLRVVKSDLCVNATNQSVCMWNKANKTILPEMGSPLVCSTRLCGIFLWTSYYNSSLSSFVLTRPYVPWVELDTFNTRLRYQYTKRSPSTKIFLTLSWIIYVHILNALTYFI